MRPSVIALLVLSIPLLMGCTTVHLWGKTLESESEEVLTDDLECETRRISVVVPNVELGGFFDYAWRAALTPGTILIDAATYPVQYFLFGPIEFRVSLFSSGGSE